MMQKITVTFLAIVFLTSLAFAQERAILNPVGSAIIKHKGTTQDLEVLKIKNVPPVQQNKRIFTNPNSTLNTIDTLRLPGPWDVNFGFFGQDVMLRWFEAPADLILKKVGLACYENADNMSVEVKIVKVNWSKQDLLNAAVLHRGYYEATGNGYNDVTAFLDNPDRTGPWTSIQPGDTEPFGEDLWSDGGIGFSYTPTGNSNEPTYEWVDLSLLQEPVLQIGEIFGIAVKHTGPDMDQNRIGWWAHQYSPPFPDWKFYANGRLDPGVDYGWWSREYAWNFVAEVELTGDRGPQILSFTQLQSGVDTGPFTIDAEIIDDNPGDPSNAGVASATIWYSTDEGATWNDVAMTGSEPNFTGQIPALSPGLTVEYYIEAVDVNGNSTESSHVSFFIFAPSGAATLVIYNGFSSVDGYPQDYYWGESVSPPPFGNSTFPHDEWAYGPVPDILDSYDNIIEICNGSPAAYNDSLIALWLAGDPNRNYFLAGQEWLGARYGFADMDFQPGDFEYDVLGVDQSYNDVSYDGTSGQELPSLLLPQAGTMFGQPILDAFNALDPPADSLMYNPIFEIGDQNWIDAFDMVPGAGEVDMIVETRGIGGVPDVQQLPTGLHRTLPAGNKIVFLAYDPISLNTAIDDSYPYYHWVGWMEENTPYQALFNWFGIVLDADEDASSTPTEFSIEQNYPNPFNPSTKIKYTVPQESKITLKVFDVLGREITTLVNETKQAGSYEVNFDASHLASGVYIYTLTTDNFVASKKMMLMK